MNGPDRLSSRPRTGRWGWAALAAILVAYVAASVDGITRLPVVHGDEMMSAAAAWKLATQGIYGSDLFAGFYDADRRMFQYMPALQLLLAADFAVFGTGLLQIRLLSVATGAALVALTFLAGRQVGGTRVGLLAAWLLALYPLGSGASLETGLVLVDAVRQARYNVLAAAFGLASLCAYSWSRAHRRPGGPEPWLAQWRLFACGALVGLAYLSHMYGAFWLPALSVAMIAADGAARSRRALSALWLGAAVAVAPWGIYVLADVSGYVGQMRLYGERFDLASLSFYVGNVRREPLRYGPLFGTRLSAIGAGTWAAVLGGAAAMVWTARRARRRPDTPLAAAWVSLVVISALFALLVNWKTFTYLLSTLPLAAIVVASAACALADRQPRRAAVALLTLCLALSSGGALARLSARHERSRQATPYDAVMSAVSSHVPAGATVVAPHRYWLGLRDCEVRAWLLPLFMSDTITSDAPVPLDVALEQIDPDVIVIDDEFGSYFRGLADPAQPRHWQHQQLQRYFGRHDVREVGRVQDATYGIISVYGVGGRAGDSSSRHVP